MAKIGKPATTSIAPPSKREKKQPPATTSKPAPNDIKPIQVKVSASLHQEIKLYAVEQGITITDLFSQMYKEYWAKHG